ncbi:MAG: tyrosine-type recombinase/integrase [Gemmatimonadota bacterium]
MPRTNHGPRLALYGPDRRNGAVPKRNLRTYRWFIVWYEDGRKRERATGAVDRAAAEIELARFIVERAAGQRPAGPRGPDQMTVADALSIYAREYAQTTRSAKRIGYAIDALIDAWGDAPLANIVGRVRRRYRDDRATPRERTTVIRGKEVRRTYGVSEATVRRELGVLDAAARYCVAEGYLTHYPDEVWLPEASPARDRWLTRKEAARLIRAARADGRTRHHLPLFILIALYTAQRREAILSLQWAPNTTGGWVDLDRGIIDFRLPGAQSSKRRTVIPIPRKLAVILTRVRPRTGRYVIERNGRRVSDPKKGIAAAGVRAGIGHVHPHMLKHTAITWLVRAGVPLWEIAGWAQTSEQMIREVYGHHAPDQFRRVQEAQG